MKWWLNVIGIEMLSVTYLGNVVNPETAELGKESMMRAAAIAKDHFGPGMMQFTKSFCRHAKHTCQFCILASFHQWRLKKIAMVSIKLINRK
jgi:hypothetical protein